MIKSSDDKPLISVLMSVYNAEATLERAMDSVLKQTWQNWEFIICDDASTDNSWLIMEEYAERDRRIVLLKNEYNLGLGASLNRCLAAAQGDYIARQDADDVSAAERLQKTYAYLQTNDLAYAACGVQIFDDESIWSRRCFPEKINKHIIARCNPFFHPTMLFRRGVLDAVGGYRAVKITRRTEDYDLVMRLAALGIIGQNLQEYLYYVYEPPQAYLRHTFRTRFYEICVRLYGLRQMNAPARDYIYLGKPVIMCMVPRAVLKQLKKWQWQSRSKRDPKELERPRRNG